MLFHVQVYAEDVRPLTPFVKNNVTHILLHEVGHALISEFNLPLLGNEEYMADGFANQYITQNMRDVATQILTARAQSWVYEGSQIKPEDYDLKGEHELDIRRAYNAMCALYGADPSIWTYATEWVEFSGDELNDCSDFTPRQIEAWQRVLKPHLTGVMSSVNVELIFGDGPYKQEMEQNGVMSLIVDIMRTHNWPQPVILHFDHCDAVASWNRESRTILLCDEFVQRFVDLEKNIDF